MEILILYQGGSDIKNDMAVGIHLGSRPRIQKSILQGDSAANFKKHIGEEKEMFEKGSGLSQEANNSCCGSFLCDCWVFFLSVGALRKSFLRSLLEDFLISQPNFNRKKSV